MATICRHCGYIYPVGKAVQGAPTGLTSQFAAAVETRGSTADWLKMGVPLVVVLVLLAVIGGTYVQRRLTATWDYAAQHLPAATSYDAAFESWLRGWMLRPENLAQSSAPNNFILRAADGTCLIRFPQGEQPGLLARMTVKAVAASFGGIYAAYRHQHGDSPVARCIIFNGDRRLAEATFDGRKHPDLLASLERDFGRSMKYASPEAMMNNYQDRLSRELGR